MDTAATPDPARRLERRVVGVGVVEGVTVAVVLVVVALVVGAPVLGALGVLAGLALAGGWFLFVRSRTAGAVRAVLVEVGARPVDEESAPRLSNVVDGLCVANGVPAPELWTVPAATANAMALDAGGRTALVVTDGMVDRLGLVELEGAVANLLGRLKDGSARLATTAVAVRRLPMSSVYAPEHLVAGWLGEQYAVRSDLAAVRMTRYPPGLRDALGAVADAGAGVPADLPVVTGPVEHLWLVPTATGTDDGGMAATTGQPLDLRIAVLDEL